MLNIGQILDGKYEIINILGRGGMGTVYLCKNNRLGNLWAVKEVTSDWNNKIDFLAEPNILKDLSHTGIVRIIDIFYENDNLYIVEDYIHGKTLKDYIDINGPITSETAIEISLQLCSILNYLHSFNPPIIYRDLKPSNIMIKPDNKVVLIDFGIARTYKEGQEVDTVILGSKGYIAPEQLGNIQSNTQTDIYSLGATMFFMLTGRTINLATELMFDENYPDTADKELIRIIKRASAIDTEVRYKSTKQLMDELSKAAIEAKYEKTKLLNYVDNIPGAVQHNPDSKSKPKKRTKIIIIAILAFIIAACIFLILALKNAASYKKASEPASPSKSIEQPSPSPAPKAEVQPPKEVIEKDTLVRGAIDSKKPVLLNTSNSKSKGKEKDSEKTIQVQFNLNPQASLANSKLSITLTHIQVIEDDIIAFLYLQNLSDSSLKVDLSKTYLVNGKNEARRSYNPNTTSLLSIPQGSGKQELKLYFKDFDFEGNNYTLKSTLVSSDNKDINLYIDVK
jgi:serine/threonine protein kinase